MDQPNASPCVNLSDFESQARERLAPMVFDYYSGGACDEEVIAANKTSWEKIKLWPRVLRGAAQPELKTRFFGFEVPMPILPAPVAMLRMAHPEGEMAVVRAANTLGLPYLASTMATTNLEDIARGAKGLKFFQLYFFRDRGLTKSLVQRAEAAGYHGLILTVDAQVLGKREADIRNRFQLPAHLKLANLDPEINQSVRTTCGSSAERMASIFEDRLNWKDLDWLQGQTNLPLGIKGILRPDDALAALDAGVKMIAVSNHGGRQLDCIPTAVDALPGVVKAIQGRAEIYVDGGIRRGSDVVKALAMGANGILVGKPIPWALGVEGQAGVEKVLAILKEETALTMVLAGCENCLQARDLLLADESV